MYPTPGLPNLIAYCRAAADKLDELVRQRRRPSTATLVHCQQMAKTWRDWADDLEKLLEQSKQQTFSTVGRHFHHQRGE